MHPVILSVEHYHLYQHLELFYHLAYWDGWDKITGCQLCYLSEKVGIFDTTYSRVLRTSKPNKIEYKAQELKEK